MSSLGDCLNTHTFARWDLGTTMRMHDEYRQPPNRRDEFFKHMYCIRMRMERAIMPPWQEAPNLQSPEQGPPVVCAAQDLLGLVNLRRTQSCSRFSDVWVGLGFGSRFFYGQEHT